MIVSYGRDPSTQYCQDCMDQIQEGEDRIVEFHLRMHMYFLRLLIDDKIAYAQFSRVIPKLDKSREWACYMHYCRFGLFRPPDWDQVQYVLPTEQQICENKDHIREGLAEAARVGVLQYFTVQAENRSAEVERAGASHYSADEEELVSSGEGILVPEDVAGAGRENQRPEPISSNEDDHSGEEVVWEGRETWRRDQQVIEPRYNLLA